MIEILAKSQGNIIGAKASGKVTDADYKDVLIPAMDKLLAEHSRGRFLYYLSDEFQGFELAAVKDDLEYIIKHHKSIDKVALVGGPKWVAWTTKVANHFVEAEVKKFAAEELEQAWEWIKA